MFKPSDGILAVQNSVNKLFINKEPWQIVIITTTSVLSAVWIYEFLNKDESIISRTKKYVFKMARKYIPLVRNQVQAELDKVNKTFEDMPLEMKIESPSSATLVKPDGNPIIVPAGSMLKTIYFIKMPAVDITSGRTIIMLGVYNQGKLLEEVKVKFIGPIINKSKTQSI